MLTGRRTFTADTRDELLELIATQEPKPPRQIDDRIPKELERICLKALSRRASDRYTTAKDMAEDLRQFLAISKASGNAASPTKRSIPTSPRVPRETWHLDEIGEVVVVKLGDEFLGPADLVRDYTDGLLDELDAGNWRKVVIDFGDLRYINSSAFIPLLRVVRRVHETGGRVRLCNVSTYVYEIMRAIRIDRVFDIAEDRESALRDW